MTLTYKERPLALRRYRVLIDTDVLIELLYNRSPFVENAEFLLIG